MSRTNRPKALQNQVWHALEQVLEVYKDRAYSSHFICDVTHFLTVRHRMPDHIAESVTGFIAYLLTEQDGQHRYFSVREWLISRHMQVYEQLVIEQGEELRQYREAWIQNMIDTLKAGPHEYFNLKD